MPTTSFRQGIPLTNRIDAPPQVHRFPTGSACAFVKHPTRVTVIRYKGAGIVSNGIFFQGWPIFQIFPRSSVPSSTTHVPLFAIIRHLRSCAVQHICETLFLPNPPLLWTPTFPTKSFFNETL